MTSHQKKTKAGLEVIEPFRCDPDLGSDRLYYLALRAVDRYHDQWGADPGVLVCKIQHYLQNSMTRAYGVGH